jgi:peptide/nickel transport system ATP-binding protein
MYAGEIVEQADVNSLFEQPLHPYTQGLIGSIPILGEIKERLRCDSRLVPNLVNLPPGCRFAPRCTAREKFGSKICTEIKPELKILRPVTKCAAGCQNQDHQGGRGIPAGPLK